MILAEVVIAAEHALAGVVKVALRGAVVAAGRIAIVQRRKHLDVAQSVLVEPGRRDDIAWEGRAGVGVGDRLAQPAEVAGTVSGLGKNLLEQFLPALLDEADVDEEKGLV